MFKPILVLGNGRTGSTRFAVGPDGHVYVERYGKWLTAGYPYTRYPLVTRERIIDFVLDLNKKGGFVVVYSRLNWLKPGYPKEVAE